MDEMPKPIGQDKCWRQIASQQMLQSMQQIAGATIASNLDEKVDHTHLQLHVSWNHCQKILGRCRPWHRPTHSGGGRRRGRGTRRGSVGGIGHKSSSESEPKSAQRRRIMSSRPQRKTVESHTLLGKNGHRLTPWHARKKKAQTKNNRAEKHARKKLAWSLSCRMYHSAATTTQVHCQAKPLTSQSKSNQSARRPESVAGPPRWAVEDKDDRSFIWINHIKWPSIASMLRKGRTAAGLRSRYPKVIQSSKRHQVVNLLEGHPQNEKPTVHATAPGARSQGWQGHRRETQRKPWV